MFFFVSSIGKQNERGQETKSELNVGHKTGKKEVVSLKKSRSPMTFGSHTLRLLRRGRGAFHLRMLIRAQRPNFLFCYMQGCR